MQLAHLPIEVEDIPYQFDMRINDTTYTFIIRYNTEGDFYTLSVLQGDDVIIRNVKLIYGSDIFAGIPETMKWGVIPYDFSNNATKCNKSTLMSDVKPYIVAGD